LKLKFGLQHDHMPKGWGSGNIWTCHAKIGAIFKIPQTQYPPTSTVKAQAHIMAPKVAEKAVKAPATKAPAAKKVVKKATKGGASKKKSKAVESYKIYIYKVLKQVCACFWFWQGMVGIKNGNQVHNVGLCAFSQHV
jgi:hypothetical protein